MAFVSIVVANVLLCFAFSIQASHLQADEYCSQNLFYDIASNSTPLAKEFPSREYGIVGLAKNVYCCARNYESIEWLKNGREYPWPKSSFGLNLVANRNQTLQAASLTKEDSGTYTCRITERSTRTIHTYSFYLTVFNSGTGYTDIPLPTYVPPKNQDVNVNQRLRLYCEAFVGKIDLPDAKTEITWYKESPNSSISSSRHGVHLTKVIRDHGLTIGSYLKIDHVNIGDDGNYVCHISNAGDQKINVIAHVTVVEVPDIWLIIERIGLMALYPMCIIVFLIIMMYCLYSKYGQEIYVHVRQRARRDKYDAVKDYDIFLLYQVRDKDFVIDTLMPELRNKYGYVVNSHLLKQNSALTMECQSRIVASRCVLLVWSMLSVANENNVSNDKMFSQMLQFITTLHKRVICIVMEDDERRKMGRCCFEKELMNSLKTVDFVKWIKYNTAAANKTNSPKAWCTLRSRLPPITDKNRRSSSAKLCTSMDSSRHVSQRLDVP